jgi:hypothetical protein
MFNFLCNVLYIVVCRFVSFLLAIDEFGDKTGAKCTCFPHVSKKSKIPKGGNQNPYIEEEQTRHWQMEKSKRTNNDLQNIYT